MISKTFKLCKKVRRLLLAGIVVYILGWIADAACLGGLIYWIVKEDAQYLVICLGISMTLFGVHMYIDKTTEKAIVLRNRYCEELGISTDLQ